MRRARVDAALELQLGREALASGSVGAVGPLEVDEVLQHRFAERRELDDDAGRQVAGVEREVAAPEARRAAERRSDVPHRREVPHLLDRDVERSTCRQAAAVAGSPRPDARPSSAVAQAERGVQVRAHQVVLELGGFVERVQDGSRSASRGAATSCVHGSS